MMMASGTAKPAVVARKLTRQYLTGGQAFKAVDGIDLIIPANAFTVVLGPSGCGKSTLLNLIGALDSPTEGAIQVAGVELTAIDAAQAADFRRRHVGFLFQDGGLIDAMSVGANVELPLAYREVAKSERSDRVVGALAVVGMADRLGSQVRDLSGGERQRVGLARALVTDPPVLLCDEPTAALDERNSAQIAEWLSERAAGGRTVICSSHDPQVMSRAGFLVQMLRGRIEREIAR